MQYSLAKQPLDVSITFFNLCGDPSLEIYSAADLAYYLLYMEREEFSSN